VPSTTETVARPDAGPDGEDARRDLAARIGELAADRGLTVAVAESLTGGMVAMALATAPNSSTWFRGALVAYHSDVKHEVLGVPPGPVVSAEAAAAMATGVRRLLRADVVVAVTGAGGPGPQDGRAPGTVFLALESGDGDHRLVRLMIDANDPERVCETTAATALRILVQGLERPTG
jgi:nicotinamide-nucleotide amidase